MCDENFIKHISQGLKMSIKSNLLTSHQIHKHYIYDSMNALHTYYTQTSRFQTKKLLT